MTVTQILREGYPLEHPRRLIYKTLDHCYFLLNRRFFFPIRLSPTNICITWVMDSTANQVKNLNKCCHPVLNYIIV